MVEIEKLDALYQAATPIPVYAEVLDGHAEAWFTTSHIRRCASFHGKDALANLHAYVALHNAWPAIKRELEAARVLRTFFKDLDYKLQAFGLLFGEGVYNEVQNALDAYDAATKGGAA